MNDRSRASALLCFLSYFVFRARSLSNANKEGERERDEWAFRFCKMLTLVQGGGHPCSFVRILSLNSQPSTLDSHFSTLEIHILLFQSCRLSTPTCTPGSQLPAPDSQSSNLMFSYLCVSIHSSI